MPDAQFLMSWPLSKDASETESLEPEPCPTAAVLCKLALLISEQASTRDCLYGC